MRLPIWMAVGIAAGGLSGLSGQTVGPVAGANLPAFEVASIKPSNPTAGMVGVYTYPGGRVFLGHMTLQLLIEAASGLQEYDVTGGPAWTRETQYDIDARVPANSESAKLNAPRFSRPMNGEQHEMLYSLLADRFQLRFHRESKDGPVYFLLRGDKRLKLNDPARTDVHPWLGSPVGNMINGAGIKGVNASMADVVYQLGYYMGRPVLDQTGIKGNFDFEYDYVSGDAHPDVVSTIITSLEEIGLKLKAGKAPVETIVIDHAEKPVDN